MALIPICNTPTDGGNIGVPRRMIVQQHMVLINSNIINNAFKVLQGIEIQNMIITITSRKKINKNVY